MKRRLALALFGICGVAMLGCDSNAPENTTNTSDNGSTSAAKPSGGGASMSAADSAEESNSDMLPSGHPPIDPADMQAAMDAARQETGEAMREGASAAGRMARQATSGGETLTWSVPDSWTAEEPSSSMRKAQYVLPGADGAEAGELVVFFFPGGAGTTEANVARWRGQFTTPTGDPLPDQMFKRTQREVNSLAVTVVDMVGTYNPGAMSFGGQAPPPKENQRMLGAIVQTPAGGWYFRAVGPGPTMAARADEIDEMIESFEMKSSE